MEPRRQAAADKVAAAVPCEVGPILAAAGFAPRCFGRPAPGQHGWGHHHRRKASDHGCDDPHGPNALWCCPACNRFVEDHPAEARARTGDRLVVRPGDPEYDQLGRPSKIAPPAA